MTAEQVKALFRQRGITFTRWAEENGYTAFSTGRPKPVTVNPMKSP
jgi:hypothetical protein